MKNSYHSVALALPMRPIFSIMAVMAIVFILHAIEFVMMQPIIGVMFQISGLFIVCVGGLGIKTYEEDLGREYMAGSLSYMIFGAAIAILPTFTDANFSELLK